MTIFFSILFMFVAGGNSLYANAIDGVHERGEKVVERAVCTVTAVFHSTALPDASVFLKRIAKAESNYGNHSATYRHGYYGGIWQVDRIGFAETKNIERHPSLRGFHRAIRQHFTDKDQEPVEWMEVPWQRCIVPEFSCLAARLFLAVIPLRIPRNLSGQAHYWKRYYNTPVGAGTIAHFIQVNNDEALVTCTLK